MTRLPFVALLFAIAPAASAQSPAGDSRWTAWVGCWQPVTHTYMRSNTSFICIAPAGANAVEVATVDSGKVFARDTIDASGARTPLASEGCTGWRSGQWSSDGRRVYLRSELNCSGDIKRVSTGMLAFSSDDGWIDVQTIRSGTSAGTRSTLYTLAGSWLAGSIPPEFASLLSTVGAANSVSRMLAGTDPLPADVVDASKHVDPSVVETWLIERGEPFALDAKTLAQLADAGVPGSVTDVMIAVTYPGRFTFDRETKAQESTGGGGGGAVGGYSRTPYFDPYAEALACSQWGVIDRYGDPSYSYDPCARGYRYDPYAFRGYYGYGAYGYYGSDYTRYYSSPVIVVDRSKTEPPHGRLVNGQGYTRGRSTAGSANDGAARSSPPPSTGRSSSGSSKSGGSSSGSSSGGRTAQKRGG